MTSFCSKISFFDFQLMFVKSMLNAEVLRLAKRFLKSLQENSGNPDSGLFVLRDCSGYIHGSNIFATMFRNDCVTKHIWALCIAAFLLQTDTSGTKKVPSQILSASIPVKRSLAARELSKALSHEAGKQKLVSRFDSIKSVVYGYFLDVMDFKSNFYKCEKPIDEPPPSTPKEQKIRSEVERSALALSSILCSSPFIKELLTCPVIWKLFSESGPVLKPEVRKKNEFPIYKVGDTFNQYLTYTCAQGICHCSSFRSKRDRERVAELVQETAVKSTPRQVDCGRSCLCTISC
jgi:hypothetical protein